MPVDLCRHLVGKTPRNVCHSDSASIRFAVKSADRMDIFSNQLIQFYLNDTINLRHLTQRIFLFQDSLCGFPRLFTVTSEHICLFTS